MGAHQMVGLSSLPQVLFEGGGGEMWEFGLAVLTVRLDFRGDGLLIVVGCFIVVYMF